MGHRKEGREGEGDREWEGGRSEERQQAGRAGSLTAGWESKQRNKRRISLDNLT